MAKILIIDAAKHQRDLLAEFLELGGHQVFDEAHGGDGLWAAAESQPDLVLLDIELNGPGGLAILNMLRVDPATAHIPVLALASDVNDVGCRDAETAGAFACVDRSLSLSMIGRYVEMALSASSINRE